MKTLKTILVLCAFLAVGNISAQEKAVKVKKEVKTQNQTVSGEGNMQAYLEKIEKSKAEIKKQKEMIAESVKKGTLSEEKAKMKKAEIAKKEEKVLAMEKKIKEKMKTKTKVKEKPKY